MSKLDVNHINIKQLVDKIHTLYIQKPCMVHKVKTTVNINEDLKKLAEEFGINLSAFLELKLFEHFRELILMKEGRNSTINIRLGHDSRDWKNGFHFAILEYSKHRNEFIEWLSSTRNDRVWKRYVRYLDQLLLGRTIATPRELAELIKQYEAEKGKMSRHRKIAIRNYLNFLVKKGYYRKSQVIDYYPLLELDRGGIRPATQSFTTDDKIREAHNYLLQLGDEKRLLIFYLLLFSGVRLTEACDIVNNFDSSELTVHNKIAYYDMLSMYKRISDTKAKAEQSKRAWVAFMPVWVAERLQLQLQLQSQSQSQSQSKNLRVNEANLRGRHFCNGIILPNMLRKWFSNFLARQGVEEKIIEFMTGKTSEKILRRHYLELLQESINVYEKIVDKFPVGVV